MLSKPIRYTFLRNSIYYIQFLSSKGMFRRSLCTDSRREAATLMIALMPYVSLVKTGQLTCDEFSRYVELAISNRAWLSSSRLAITPAIPEIDLPVQTPKPKLALSEAWVLYKREKGKNWTAGIASANERYAQVLLAVLGHQTCVTAVTKQGIHEVMETVEGLPKRVIQPYRSMTIDQLLACDDVPSEDLIGTEAIHKHLKIYKSLFKTFLCDAKGFIESAPTDGVVAPPSSARYGAYSNSEIKKFVRYAISSGDGWIKWIVLLLAYTGARRGEIARLTKEQVCFDDDSIRHYLLIKDGKTDNATRQVPIHQHLIDLGFIDFVNNKQGSLFPEVASTNMPKISKVLSDIREQLGIPYKDMHNQRRIVHSFRHSVVTAASGWMNNVAHLQQVIGHEKTGTGITGRYMHTFPLPVICHIIDGLNWL